MADKPVCVNHPSYKPSSKLRKATITYEPMDDCFICWTAYIENKYEDQDLPVEGRDMVKLLHLFNKEMALLNSGSIDKDTGFADPQYER